jgi:hypothetical protein
MRLQRSRCQVDAERIRKVLIAGHARVPLQDTTQLATFRKVRVPNLVHRLVAELSAGSRGIDDVSEGDCSRDLPPTRLLQEGF